jgi:hypothetical protein
VHGADLHRNRVGFWMEFVQGQRLDDLVAFQGLLSAEEAATIGQELCSALAAVHDAGLVHRDVKAQNVIREPKGRVVLMDFGAGQLIADAVGGGGAGTPLYLAPEMFADAPASAQTDVYALGVLLYYLVTAGYPVPARSIEELKEAHARGRQRPLLVARPGLPRGFVTVVEKMLAVDPADRYQTAHEALAGLKRFTAPASIARKAVIALGAIVLGLIVVTTLGLLSTATFNIVMGRTDRFAGESVATWFRWGLSSLVAPVVYMSAAAISLIVLATAARLVLRLSRTAQVAFTATRRAFDNWSVERGLDESAFRLQVVIGLGTLALAGLFVAFWECLAPVTVYINDAPLEALAVLDPAREMTFDRYGQSLDVLVFAYLLLLYAVFAEARRRGQTIPRWARVTAFVVPALALMMWEMPYRMAYHSSFARVDFAGARCYELGRDDPQVLLFCPDVVPPRNRIVLSSDPRLAPRGVMESVFTPLSRSQPVH